MPITPPETRSDISALLQIMRNLRDRQDGCPWDVEQDFKSISPYTIEEAYEVADAIDRENLDDLKEELGDLLLQVVFHSQMADEVGEFTFADVVKGICDKMVRRHPHVFVERDSRTSAEQLISWEEIKAKEKSAKGQSTARILDDVPVGLPAMTRALKMQKKAAKVGFDWDNAEQVLQKLNEEAAELVEAQAENDRPHIEEEFGDLLFNAVNLARHLDIDPENSLRRTNEKFIRRFNKVEDAVANSGKPFGAFSLDELEEFWQRAKSTDHQTR